MFPSFLCKLRSALLSKQVFFFFSAKILAIYRVFLSRNNRLIVASRKFDVLKTIICPRSDASRANLFALRSMEGGFTSEITNKNRRRTSYTTCLKVKN